MNANKEANYLKFNHYNNIMSNTNKIIKNIKLSKKYSPVDDFVQSKWLGHVRTSSALVTKMHVFEKNMNSIFANTKNKCFLNPMA